MDRSKTSTDVLALGRTLVQELKLDPGVDTLGRWMAHYIAQLITEAENAPEGETRREKESLAADAIIKLWSHRSNYENRINPLFELKPVIQLLRSLDPNQNLWVRHIGLGSGNSDAIRTLYDSFRHLMVYLLTAQLSKSADLKRTVTHAGATSNFQAEREREILASLDRWLSESEVAALSSRALKPTANAASENLSQDYANSLLADAQKALELVAAELTA
jgi:hypothetical protein